MINKKLLQPDSIVVVGGSNDVRKPGGKVLKNLLDGGYAGKLYVTNLKEREVQGIASYIDPADLPDVDLAIIAIAARFIPDVVHLLATQKNTGGFIVLSAGFSEESMEGARLEQQLVEIVDDAGASLIGPNCIGILTPWHHSVFTYPLPVLSPDGCDFISGSGATACFIMESGIPKGLRFANVFSVGNSAQLGVEEILQHLDESFDPDESPRVKLLYIETISNPGKLLKHASSLIRKGCKIAAIKAGSSDAGSRAASSHTGAIASSDAAVEALFRRAGIVRCHGREELIAVASVFMHSALRGKNFAIITHAGGPAVMLTDALSNGGLVVPHIESPIAYKLLEKLFPGSSVANPIDFLATGTAEQLGQIIDFVEKHFDEIDAMVVIFGTPGLVPVHDVYDVLDMKMASCSKPIYPVLPSVTTATEEVKAFIDKGRVNFPDEVLLGQALSRVYHQQMPSDLVSGLPEVDISRIREVMDHVDDAYLMPDLVQSLLDAAGIPRAPEAVVATAEEAVEMAQLLGFPVAMKVVGPVHKSDVGGVSLNLSDEDSVEARFHEMMAIEGATAVMIQPMLSGMELFVGAKREDTFGHLVLCGLGGVLIEIMQDVAMELAPVDRDIALTMIRRLRGYKLIQGYRGRAGVDELAFADIVARLSALLAAAPEIAELDLNPLLGSEKGIFAVDARIRIEKSVKSPVG